MMQVMARIKQACRKRPKKSSSTPRKKAKKIQGLEEIPSPKSTRPKMKSGGSADHAGKASTSAEPTDNRFKTVLYQYLYNDKYGGKKVWAERVVDFESFESQHADFVAEWFKYQKWDTLLAVDEPIYPDLVRLFYTHFDLANRQKGVIHTWVKGTNIVLDEDVLAEIFEIPKTGVHDYPGHKWSEADCFDRLHAIKLVLGDEESDMDKKPSMSDLPMTSRLLQNILSQTVINRGGRKSSLTYLDMFMMYCILKKKRVNLPRIMIAHMTAAYKAKDDNVLPYGMWLTKVFHHFQVDLSNEAAQKNPHELLSIRTIENHLGYKYDGHEDKWNKVHGSKVPGNTDRLPKKAKIVQVEDDDSDDVAGNRITTAEGTSEAAIVESLVVQEMLKKIHPTIFTAEVMQDIRNKATSQVRSRFNVDSEPSTDKGNISIPARCSKVYL